MSRPTIEPATWCRAADQGLQRSAGEDLPVLRQEVEQGHAQLWRINAGESWMITRIEDGDLVVCCYEGRRVGEVIPWLIATAKQNQLARIRFHTSNPVYARLIARDYGIEELERVYVYRLTNTPEE